MVRLSKHKICSLCFPSKIDPTQDIVLNKETARRPLITAEEVSNIQVNKHCVIKLQSPKARSSKFSASVFFSQVYIPCLC